LFVGFLLKVVGDKPVTVPVKYKQNDKRYGSNLPQALGAQFKEIIEIPNLKNN